MSRLYACIISPDAARDREALMAAAGQFSYAIEMLGDGVIFDVSGLERLIGKRSRISAQISDELRKSNTPGSVAVAETVEMALLLARQQAGEKEDSGVQEHSPETFRQLPLRDLQIAPDTLNVLDDLGIRNVQQLLDIPREELIGRYGREFQEVIDVIEQRGPSLLTPNFKENHISWAYELDHPVEDFEQLIFLLNHGLDKLFEQTAHHGYSTEHLEIAFRLNDKTARSYEIKTSFPTLDKTFWLKLINLRIALDPPGSEIAAINVVSNFTRPRASQRGLYAVSRPEPESLLLTVGKLKKLVGEENVGVPVILNERLAEAFTLRSDALPHGRESVTAHLDRAVIAFSYFHPPVAAEVLVRDKRLVFLRSRLLSGHVTQYSGVWKSGSKWWDRAWRTQEWDVEIEGGGIYRLCRVGKEWFLAGEYD